MSLWPGFLREGGDDTDDGADAWGTPDEDTAGYVGGKPVKTYEELREEHKIRLLEGIADELGVEYDAVFWGGGRRMSAHCDCDPDEQDHYQEEISPNHHDGETWATKCHNCWGLVRIH